MTDSEKLALIELMIADYWEYLPAGANRHAEELVVCIASVINFKGGDTNG